MDLGTVTDVVVEPELSSWRPGDVWLAGGTELFGAPRPDAVRLLDLTTLGWPSLVASTATLEIAATCTLAELETFGAPDDWPAAELFGQCARAFRSSFKIGNVATVGGNLCCARPDAPMVALAVALDGEVTLWSPDGSERRLPAAEFVLDAERTALAPGEVLRALKLPATALASPTAFSQRWLTPLGASAALVVGRLDPDGLVLTVSASVRRPVRVTFSGFPSGPELREAVAEAVTADLYEGDGLAGDPRWRAHLTRELTEEIRLELGALT